MVNPIGAVQIIGMVTLSVFFTASNVILEQCKLEESAVVRKESDQWVVVYKEDMCGYSATPVLSFDNLKWTLENAYSIAGGLLCEDMMDVVLPSLDTVRVVFSERDKIESTKALIVRNADTSYRYVVFEKPFKNRKVLRSEFVLSQKGNNLIAVCKTTNGSVKLYRCTADQRACFIHHKSELAVGRGKSRVETIILNENHLHALYFQNEIKRYAISSVIVENDHFSKVMVLRELAWDTIHVFALWDAHRGEQENFLIIGRRNESQADSSELDETYLISEMSSIDPQFVTHVNADHVDSISIQTVLVPTIHRPISESELNRVLPGPQLMATTRYMESLAGIDPLTVYEKGPETMDDKLRHHVDFANRMRKVHRLRNNWMYTPIRNICRILPSWLTSQAVLNLMWWCHIMMWITLSTPFILSTLLLWSTPKAVSVYGNGSRSNIRKSNKRGRG